MLSAHALVKGGAEVVVYDDNEKSVAEAKAAGLTTQDLRDLDWSKVSALVLAPGVPLTHPEPHWAAELARKAKVEIIGDIELFCRERAKSGARLPASRHYRHQRQIDHHRAHRASDQERRPRRADGRQYRRAGAGARAVRPGPRLRAGSLVLSDRSRAFAESHRRHSAQRLGRSSRPPRQHGKLRRHQGAAGGGCRHRGDRRRRRLDARRRRAHRTRRQKSRARVGARPAARRVLCPNRRPRQPHSARDRRQGADSGRSRRHRLIARRAQCAERRLRDRRLSRARP